MIVEKKSKRIDLKNKKQILNNKNRKREIRKNRC